MTLSVVVAELRHEKYTTALIRGWSLHNLLVIGAALIAGFSWYLTGMPLLSLKVIGCFLPLLHIVAIALVRKDKRLFAGLLLLPQAAVTVYFGVLVLTQHG